MGYGVTALRRLAWRDFGGHAGHAIRLMAPEKLPRHTTADGQGDLIFSIVQIIQDVGMSWIRSTLAWNSVLYD